MMLLVLFMALLAPMSVWAQNIQLTGVVTDTSKEPIKVLYEEVAIARGVSVEELRESIYNNYNRIFKWVGQKEQNCC